MNMPQGTSTSLHDPSTPAIARLVGTAGGMGRRLRATSQASCDRGGFFWFDLQNPGDDELAEFCHSLLLSAGAIDSVTHASQRSSFSLAAGWVRAVRPAAVGTRPIAWLKADWFAPASLEAAMSANCSLVYKFPVPDNRFPRTLRVIQRLDD
jgi:hypothetical protein